MFVYNKMAATLVMCVVGSLLWSNCSYHYWVGFGNIRGVNLPTVRLLLSSIKYVHERQLDEGKKK